MSFTSAVFLVIFLPACVLLNYFIPKRCRNALVLIASVVFYAWCGLKFLLLMLVSAAIAYAFGRGIGSAERPGRRKALLFAGIAVHLLALFYYKYLFALFPDTGLWLRGVLTGGDAAVAGIPALPLGISFYTFSLLSYLLDVFFETCEAQKNPLIVFLYVVFFPKVTQGPIMRYESFAEQLQDRTVTMEMLDRGLERFIIGMLKKVMIADQLGEVVSYAFSDVEGIGTLSAWIGILAYLLQLYYDFSGYSDMAVGLGAMLGFELPENFEHPYLAHTVSDFWNRWHITLGAWFKNYVYTPVFRTVQFAGFLKKKEKKGRLFLADLLALLVTWMLVGVWHGSGWKFFLYGMWYFAFIALERLRAFIRKKKKAGGRPVSDKTGVLDVLQRILTVAAVLFGQVIFRARSLEEAACYWGRMLSWNTTDGLLILHELDHYILFAMAAGVLFCFPVYDALSKKLRESGGLPRTLHRLALLAAGLIAICYAVSGGYSAFLYEVF